MIHFPDECLPLGAPIDDSFPDERLLVVSLTSIPWYTDPTNYLGSGIIPDGYSSQQKRSFSMMSRDTFRKTRFLYKLCVDGIVRRCVPQEEVPSIISHCLDLPCRGHASTKILYCGFLLTFSVQKCSCLCQILQ